MSRNEFGTIEGVGLGQISADHGINLGPPRVLSRTKNLYMSGYESRTSEGVGLSEVLCGFRHT